MACHGAAYALSLAAGSRADTCVDGTRCRSERSYDWVREYRFRFDEDPEHDPHVTTCVLCLGGGRVTYRPAPSRLALQKRPRVAVPRPSVVTVRKRPPTEAEEGEHEAVRQRLTEAPPGDESRALHGDHSDSPGLRSSSPSPQLSD